MKNKTTRFIRIKEKTSGKIIPTLPETSLFSGFINKQGIFLPIAWDNDEKKLLNDEVSIRRFLPQLAAVEKIINSFPYIRLCNRGSKATAPVLKYKNLLLKHLSNKRAENPKSQSGLTTIAIPKIIPINTWDS